MLEVHPVNDGDFPGGSLKESEIKRLLVRLLLSGSITLAGVNRERIMHNMICPPIHAGDDFSAKQLVPKLNDALGAQVVLSRSSARVVGSVIGLLRYQSVITR